MQNMRFISHLKYKIMPSTYYVEPVGNAWRAATDYVYFAIHENPSIIYTSPKLLIAEI